MKVLIYGVLFHLSCLFIFTYVYFSLYENEFENVLEEGRKNLSTNVKIMDCFYFATTVEAGVGLTSLQPTTNLAKFMVCVQQIFMIIGNIFILYFSLIQPKQWLQKIRKALKL